MYIPYKISEKKTLTPNEFSHGQASIADNRPSQLRQNQLVKEIGSGGTTSKSASGVAQMMFTRSQITDLAQGLIGGRYSEDIL